MTAAEPTLDDVVQMAADLHYHQAICGETALALAVDLTGVTAARAARLIVAAMTEFATHQVQTIHIDDEDGAA